MEIATMPSARPLARLAFSFILAGGLLSALATDGTAQDGERQWRHAGALNGTPKYPKGFAHFDYVNVDAPQGGKTVLGATGSFDTFNPILPRGESAPGTNVAAPTLIYETLLKPSMDEADISAEYGLLADGLYYPEDYSFVTYRLHPDAKWHDGVPVSAEDVIWTFEVTTANNPNIGFYYSSVTSVEKTGDREVTFTFDQKGNRELPKILGGMNILPKHWWEGTDADGNARDITKGTLEPPLGSGPYRIGDFQAGRFVNYERVEDAWANDLNVNVGYYNISTIRYDFYKDSTVIVEAFKAGETDWRTENSASNWVNRYNNPARDRGDIILETKADRARGVMQGYVMNTRSEIFQDRRVREALILAFDFTTLNRTLLSDLYFQPTSYFSGTELASSGTPKGDELALLEPYRDQLPEELFTEPYKLPQSSQDPTEHSKLMRQRLRKALGLMREAGWELSRDRKLVNQETGKPFVIRYADFASPLNEKTVLRLKADFAKIGVEIEYQPTDIPSYINKRNAFDFDMMVVAWGQSLSPGNEQRGYWGSSSRDQEGSRNFIGIADPIVDELIEKIIFAEDRDALITATHALDRVLLAGDYVIPQFFYPFDRFARWDIFGHPDPLPLYSVGFPDIWWYDEAKAAQIER
ncbi:MAG: extracellular solute-binding protein [Pseudomonadota bacterium]